MAHERLHCWRMVEPGKPLELQQLPLPAPGPGEVLIEVAACGLCHTDYGFLYGGVRPNAPLPLTLGHEIVGRVAAACPEVGLEPGASLLVPAVLPCGECELCRNGRGNVCRRQKMPGNDFDGGFASHFLAPARFLCPVPGDGDGLDGLAVAADAVGTAYQAVLRSGATEGSLAVVVGAGGVGCFAAQTAKELGARVAAIDIDAARLEALADTVDLPLDAAELDARAIRERVKGFERAHDLSPFRRKILECSGTAAGQQTAWSLLTYDATLVVVGFTMDKPPLRLSNLMAFDARAVGNWGCLPEHFPDILRLIESGALRIEPFVERHPMSSLNDLLAEETHQRRPILIPDF